MKDRVYPYYRVRVIVEECTAAGDGLMFAKEINAQHANLKTFIQDRTAALDTQYRVIEAHKKEGNR